MINQLQEKYQLSILSLLGAVSILGIAPFIVVRYLQNNMIALFIDVAVIVSIVLLVAYAHYSKKIRIISAIVSVLISATVIIVSINNGIDSFLWMYPALAVSFILLKPIEASGLNMLTAFTVVTMADIFDTISPISFIMTVLILSLCLIVYASHSAKQFELLETINTVDPLTGALNRRALSADMAATLAKSERDGSQQLLAILDLDHFKKINDKFGHAVGDHVLKDFVSITTNNIRKYDKLYRFGGEEFVLLIPAIGAQQQRAFIDNVRTAIKSELKTPDGEVVTVSFGVTTWIPGTTADSWLKRADDALYKAKESGRDCAVFCSK